MENPEPSELSPVPRPMELFKACNEAAELLIPRQTNPRISLSAARQNVAEVIRQTVASFTQPVIDFAEWGWTIIANAGGGDWERESPDWQEAAGKYRDEFHDRIRHYASSDPSGTDSSSATRVSSETTIEEDIRNCELMGLQFHGTHVASSPSTPVTGIEVEKWEAVQDSDLPHYWHLRIRGVLLKLWTTEKDCKDIAAFHNASLERILGERRGSLET